MTPDGQAASGATRALRRVELTDAGAKLLADSAARGDDAAGEWGEGGGTRRYGGGNVLYGSSLIVATAITTWSASSSVAPADLALELII